MRLSMASIANQPVNEGQVEGGRGMNSKQGVQNRQSQREVNVAAMPSGQSPG
jgi:hypothetical protein